MKNIKKLVAAAALCMFTISAVGCNMIEKTPEAINKTVVAKVGDKKITKGEVDSNFRLKTSLARLKQQYGEGFEQNPQVKEMLKKMKISVAQQMAMQEVFDQKAQELKVKPSEEELKKEVDKNISDIKQQQQIKSDKELEEALKMQGITKADLENGIRDSVILERLRTEIAKNVKVDEKEMQQYYNTHKDKYPKDAKNPTKVHLAHIILQPQSEEEEVKAQSEIKSIKEELNKGADFATLAKKYSKDGSKEKGGDLGTVPAVNSGFDEQFMEAALPLKDGEVSEPVRTQFGYHLIKMIKKDQKEAKPFAEVKNQIKEILIEKKKGETIEAKFKEIQDNAKIKVYEDKIA